MQFVQSESFDYPVLEDTKSSPNGVFIRRNVVESEYTSPESGETKTKYNYEEAFISFEEYSSLSVTQYAVSQNSGSGKTEEEIIDQYTQDLIKDGVL